MESDAKDNKENETPEAVAEAATQTLTGAEAPASEELRESQIQNAVAFLNHPKVQGASEAAKTSFLEKKGLTAAEIKESFSRAGNSSTSTNAVASTASPALPIKPYQGTQATVSALQPRRAQLMQQLPDTSRSLRWTQVILGASAVFAGAYALKQLLSPLVVTIYRRIYGIQAPKTVAEAQKADEKRTAELVAAAIESQTKELKSTVDSLKDMVLRLDKGKQTAYASTGLSVDDLRSELQAFASTISSAATPRLGADSELKAEMAQIKQMLQHSNRATENGSLTPKSKNTGSAYQPYSVSNGPSRVAPPAARALQKQETEQPTPEATSDPSQPSYMEVLEMLERGETPPNVRTDINDKPPNPNQALPNSNKAPRAKPWERAGSTASSLSNGELRSGEGDNTFPTSVTEPDSTSTARARIHGRNKLSGGAWRPPPVPQASVPYHAPTPNESEVDTVSVHSADRSYESEE